MRPEPARAPARGMPWAARAVLLAAALAPAAVVAPAPGRAADLTPQQQVESRLLCHCGCAGLTVRTCTCGTADAIRGEIGERLARGESPEQVVDAFVARFGEQVLPAPTKQGFNLVGWVTPFAALLLAGSVLLVALRRWSAAGAAPATPGGAPPLRGVAAIPGVEPASLSPRERETMKRVERELKERL